MKTFVLKYFVICFITFSSLWADEWEVIGEMPIPVKGAQAVVHNSLIYIIGGYSDSTFSPINRIQIFNPQDTSWIVIEDTLTIGRYGHIVVKDEDNAWIFGGVNSEDSLNKSLETWNFITSPFKYTFNPIFNRKFATAQIYEDKLYTFGGYSTGIVEDSTSIDYMVIYDINSKALVYSDAQDFTSENTPIHQMSALIGNNIYIFGGAAWGISRIIYIYDTVENIFTESNVSLIDARAGGSAVKIDASKIALIGGYTEENQPMASVEIVEIKDRNIYNQSNAEPLNYARSEPTAVFCDSFIYVFGGRDSFDKCIPYVEKTYIEPVATTIKRSDHSNIINNFELYQNYPNPFNPSTTISFRNSKAMKIKLDIYTINGTHIKTLFNEYLYPGTHQFKWDGTDKHDDPVSSGVYFYKCDNGNASATKRMILLR